MEFVEADGLKIAYERVGAGPPLVLVHGAAEDGRIWQGQLAVLADEFTVVAWDEPGAGRSCDLPEGITLAGFAEGLAALVESLQLGPAHVAGLSWGGIVALELYRRHPGLVSSLIMIDTYAGWKGSLPADEVHARAASARRMLDAPTEDFDPTLPGLFAGDPPAAVVELLATIAADVRSATLGCELAIMAETDLSELLPQLGVPTLLAWGDSDVRSPLWVARQFQEAIPDTQLVVIEGAGHMSHLERPDPFNDVLREFCRAHPPRASGSVPDDQAPPQGQRRMLPHLTTLTPAGPPPSPRPGMCGQPSQDYDEGMATDRDDFLAWVKSRLYEAEVALHNGDAAPRRALWSRTEPVSILGALRNAYGQQEVEGAFAFLERSFSECTSYTFELQAYDVVGDMAYTAGMEHTSASMDGQPRSYTLRATQVYRREGGEWKVAHRHADTVKD